MHSGPGKLSPVLVVHLLGDRGLSRLAAPERAFHQVDLPAHVGQPRRPRPGIDTECDRQHRRPGIDGERLPVFGKDESPIWIQFGVALPAQQERESER